MTLASLFFLFPSLFTFLLPWYILTRNDTNNKMEFHLSRHQPQTHGFRLPARDCYPPEGSINSRGYWFGDDPFKFSAPVFMMQLILFTIAARSLRALLKPISQPTIISDILAGVILGPSALGCIKGFKKIFFPKEARVILDTFSLFGFIFFQLLIGVRTDVSLIYKSGRMPVAIGILGCTFSIAFGAAVTWLLMTCLSMDKNLLQSLPYIVGIQSMSAFPVIACFLGDLKILNSELGRVATSSSMVSDLCTFFNMICLAVRGSSLKTQSTLKSIGSLLSSCSLIMFLVFVLRPTALWVIRHTPEGKPVKENYIFGFFVAFLGCAIIAQIVGQGYIMGPLIAGFVIPDGPPLGSALEERIDTIVSMLFMPIFYTTTGMKTSLFSINKLENLWIIQFVVLTCFLGKTIGVMLPPLYYNMSFRDALTLSLVMNSKGVTELALYNTLLEDRKLDGQTFSILVVSMIVTTFFVSQLVRTLYDPSRRFTPYKRRTIEHNRRDAELGILTCVHNQDNVPPIIKILEASNPTLESPIRVIVLHLVELVGRSASLLITHHRHKKPSSKPNESERIVTAFRHYELNNQGLVWVDAFTSISPPVSMYEDVCSLALEKKTTLIIMPFHKQWLVGGVNSSTSIRTLNCNVLNNAPCSVGILVDRRYLTTSQPLLQGPIFFSIAVLFIGGADDREALSYAARMANHPDAKVMVIKLTCKDVVSEDQKMKILDIDVLNAFRVDTLHNKKASYKEVDVTDGADVMSVVRSMEKGGYDLVVVGRRHMESPITSGLMEWTEYPELGIIGDILASTDSEGVFSVLVVQQQARVWGMKYPEQLP